jgi:alpha-L-arabinofuranosidase
MMPTQKVMLWFNCFTFTLCLVATQSFASTSTSGSSYITVDINEEDIIAKGDRHRLIGTNIAVWDYATRYFDPKTLELLKEWEPALIRIPGGSWSDAYYWNGHGVTQSRKVKVGRSHQIDRWIDKNAFSNGKWNVDYSDYAPGFAVKSDLSADVFHGNFHIKELHDYLENQGGARAVVTVNAGTGTAELAAQWVAWAKKMDYKVDYWEVGNELEGEWEPGHFLPDGSKMTGEIYAKRFAEFAKAMKKANPEAKIGGATSGSHVGGFTPDMLRLAGEHVDFVSFHHYPTGESLVSDEELFGKIYELDDIVKRYRRWMKTYCPDRHQDMDLGITEWHIKLPEDVQTGDMTGALWTALFVGEMIKTGVDFANQWDLFTQKEEGGHGALHFNGRVIQAKSQYWAFWLWAQHMGNEIVSHDIRKNKNLKVIATKDGDDLNIMLVNMSREEPCDVNLGQFKGQYKEMETHLLSHQSYLWNDIKKEPEWSIRPIKEVMAFDAKAKHHLPPFSIKVIKLKKASTQSYDNSEDYGSICFPGIQFISNKVMPKHKTQNIVLTSRDYGMGSPLVVQRELKLKVLKGKAELSHDSMVLWDAAKTIQITPLQEGTLILGGTLGGVPIDPPLHIKVIEPRESKKVVWAFEHEKEIGDRYSDWPSQLNRDIRPNVKVWHVTLDKITPQPSKDNILSISHYGPSLDTANVIGLYADVMVSRDFDMEDPYTALRWVMQSEGKHWMPLKKTMIKDIKKGTFVRLEAKVPAEWESLMGMLYNIKLTLDTKKSVSGDIYVDNLGLIYSH